MPGSRMCKAFTQSSAENYEEGGWGGGGEWGAQREKNAFVQWNLLRLQSNSVLYGGAILKTWLHSVAEYLV